MGKTGGEAKREGLLENGAFVVYYRTITCCWD